MHGAGVSIAEAGLSRLRLAIFEHGGLEGNPQAFTQAGNGGRGLSHQILIMDDGGVPVRPADGFEDAAGRYGEVFAERPYAMHTIVGRPGIDHRCQYGNGVADQKHEVGVRKDVAELRQDHVIARSLVQEESLAGFFEGAAVEVAEHEAHGLPIGLFALGQVREEILDADERQPGAVIGGDSGFAEAE